MAEWSQDDGVIIDRGGVCMPASSPPASIWSGDFKYFPSQTIIYFFSTSSSEPRNVLVSWILVSVPDSCWFLLCLCSLSRKRDQTVDCRWPQRRTRGISKLLLGGGCCGAVVINYRVSAVGVVVAAAGNVDKICNCSFETLPNDNEYNRANES